MVKVVGCVVRMRMCNKILTGVTTLLLLASMGRAEVQVFARVDRNQAQVGEQIILTVAVVSQKPLNVQVPPTLRISGTSCSQVRGPVTSEEMSISGGRLLRRSTAEYAYFLTMQRAGEIEIPAIPVVVEGAQFLTQPIRLTVGKSPVLEAGGPVQVRVNVSRTTVYQGEQIIVEYLLYEEAVASSRIQNRQLVRDPSFLNFWAETLEDIRRQQIPTRRETINGVAYNVLPILRYVVFPTRAGTLTIPSITVSLVAALPTGARTIWGETVLQPRQISVSSPERTIESRALPANPPAGFSGAVGSFSIVSEVDKNEVAEGDPITWKVIIEGDGNVKSVGDLRIPDLTDFRAYDPKTTASFTLAQGAVRGKLVYERVVMPLHAGISQIPGTTFTFFDPRTRQYRTLAVEAKKITVTANRAAVARTPGGGQMLVKEVGSDIRYIQPDVNSLDDESWRLTDSPFYWVSYGLPVAWVLLAFGVRARRIRMGANPARMRALGAAGEARRRLKAARLAFEKNDVHGGIQAVANALTELVAAAANTTAAGLTSPRISEVLSEKEVPEDLRKEVLATLAQCDEIRYAPTSASVDDAKAIYEKGLDLVRQLLRYLVP